MLQSIRNEFHWSLTFCFKWKCEWFCKVNSIHFFYVCGTVNNIMHLEDFTEWKRFHHGWTIIFLHSPPHCKVSYMWSAIAIKMQQHTHTSKKREQMRDITIAKPISGHVHIKQWHYSSMSCPTYLFLTISHTHAPQCSVCSLCNKSWLCTNWYCTTPFLFRKWNYNCWKTPA